MRKMRLSKNDNICKRALMNEIITGTNGLSKECKDLAREIGIKDVWFCEVTKGEIKRAIKSHIVKMRPKEVLASQKATTQRITHTCHT